jgi:hypothetical protein
MLLFSLVLVLQERLTGRIAKSFTDYHYLYSILVGMGDFSFKGL